MRPEVTGWQKIAAVRSLGYEKRTVCFLECTKIAEQFRCLVAATKEEEGDSRVQVLEDVFTHACSMPQ